MQKDCRLMLLKVKRKREQLNTAARGTDDQMAMLPKVAMNTQTVNE